MKLAFDSWNTFHRTKFSAFILRRCSTQKTGKPALNFEKLPTYATIAAKIQQRRNSVTSKLSSSPSWAVHALFSWRTKALIAISTTFSLTSALQQRNPKAVFRSLVSQVERDQKLLVWFRNSNNVKQRFKKLSPSMGNETLVKSMRHSSPSFSMKSLICHVAHQSNESFSSTVVERVIFCHRKIAFSLFL